ncbi:hypothetical protein SLS62_011183 [Diatrype stigma]|uniref:Uncharacterized protein n=1 Tax=Diatrype stigma TaxID=117547 RepID=A0AAN9U7T2_9PEZI
MVLFDWVSAAARCTGITPSELSNLEHADGHDVAGGSLTYEQISSPELQAAYGTVASAATEQANMGVVIADVALIGYEDGNGDDDDDASMTDAGYESDASTTGSTSITPSIWDHSFENGRRYHKFHEGAYHFPNDDAEQEREDMKHSMVKMLCNDQLHFAPIGPSPQAILDIGTGTGSWAMEMGERYPSASVLGVDLSPIQPDWVPPNVRFMVDDVESPWLHPRDHFDYIHFRHTVMAIKDWDILLRRCYEHTKPGGWVELQEIHHFPMSNNGNGNGSHAGGGMMPPDHPVAQYWRRIDEGLARLGVVGFGQRASEPWSESGSGSESTALELLRGAGFVEATGRRVFHIPIGPWPRNKVLKGVGVYWRTILVDGLQATALRPLMRGLRWERARVEAFLVAVRRAYLDLDLDDNEGSQMYMPLVCVYGQKPLNGRLLS